jgi:hypothetical protein
MSKTEEKSVSVNPFLASLSLKPIIKYTEWTIHNDSIGQFSNKSVKIPREVDITKGSWYEGMDFMELHQYSTPALKVLGYILLHLRWNKDYIELKPLDAFDANYPDKLVIFKTPFYNGVKELIDRGIIAKRVSRVSTYWINPSKFFLGNRLTKFSENVVSESES